MLLVALLFLAGLTASIGSLLTLTPFYGFSTVCQILGVIIYLVRLAPQVIRVNWLGYNSSRFFASSAVFIVVNIALTAY